MHKVWKEKLQVFLLTLLLTLPLLIWIFLDKAPLSGDSAGYAKETIRFHRAVRGEGNVISTYFNLLGRRKTPLIVLMPVPALFFFDPLNNLAYLLPNTIFLAITVPVFYLLVKNFYSREVALTSTLILFTMPLAYGMSRRFLPDFFIMCISIWWLYALVKSNNFNNKKWNLLLGIVTGLGFMTKITFFSLLVLPTIYVLFTRIKKDEIKNLKKTLIDLLYVILPAIAIFGPWYLYNFEVLAWQLKRSAFGDASTTTSLGPILSFGTVLSYWQRIATFAVSNYYIILGFSLIIVTAVITKFRKINFPILVFLLSASSFSIQSFGGTKELRYITPALPAIAIFIAILLSVSTREFFMRKVIFIMFFIFPALLFLNSSFPTKLNKAKLNINGQLFYSDKIEYPGHPVSVWPSSHWPLKEVLDYINLTSSESENKVMIVREVDHFNSYTLEYYRYAKNFKFENFITKGSISDPFITPSIDTAYDQVNSADYAITILGQAANPTVTNKFDNQVTNDLIDGKLPFKRVKNFYLPSGGVAAVFKKT